MTSHLHLQLFLGSQASRRKFWQHLPWNWEASFDRTYVRFMSWLFGVPPICPEFGGCMAFFNDASIFIDIFCAIFSKDFGTCQGWGRFLDLETSFLDAKRHRVLRWYVAVNVVSPARSRRRSFPKRQGMVKSTTLQRWHVSPQIELYECHWLIWWLYTIIISNMGDCMQKSAVKHGSTWTEHDEWPIWHKNYPMILIHFEVLKVNCSSIWNSRMGKRALFRLRKKYFQTAMS